MLVEANRHDAVVASEFHELHCYPLKQIYEELNVTVFTFHCFYILKPVYYQILIFVEVALPLPLPLGWTTSSAEAVHQLRPNAQPRT